MSPLGGKAQLAPFSANTGGIMAAFLHPVKNNPALFGPVPSWVHRAGWIFAPPGP